MTVGTKKFHPSVGGKRGKEALTIRLCLIGCIAGEVGLNLGFARLNFFCQEILLV